MADRPPWLDYQSGPVTVPLGPRDPQKVESSAIDLQLKRAQLAKTQKDAAKEQVGDKEIEALAKLYVSNKLVPPTRPNEVAQKAIARAMELDPNYDPELSPNRAKAIKDFSGNGQASQVVRSVNRLASHLHDMYQASEQMGGPNLGVRPLNKLVANVEQQGMPELVAQYDAAKPFVATELEKIMKGAGQPTVSGIDEAVKSLDRARSLDERRAAFKQIANLVHGALDPIRQSWNSAYGGNRAPPMWVSPDAANFFGHIDPEKADTFGGNDWRGLPGLHGVGDQPTAPPGSPPGSPPGGPLAGGGNTPPPGPGLTPATGGTKDEITRTPIDKKIAAMLNSGASSANIRAVAKQSGQPYPKLESILAWRSLHPGAKGFDVYGENIVPTTAFNRFAAHPVGAALVNAGDAMTMGFGDEMVGAAKTLKNGGSLADNIASTNFDKQMLSEANPGAALAGQIGGGTAAMLGGGAALRGLGLGAEGSWLAANPIKAAALGDAAYGGGYGYGENNDSRLLGAGVGTVAGGLGSLAGAGAAKAIGAGLTGVTNPAVQRLRAAGIPLTAGEVLGGGWKKAQDALTSVFGPGNMVARRYVDGRKALNEAAFNAAGQVIDTPINGVGQQGIDALNQAKNKAYSKALDPIQLNLNNPEFVQSMEGALKSADAIPGAELPEGYGGVSIRHYVGNQVAPDGTMTGPGFQKAYRGLAQTASKAAPKIEGHDIGQAVAQAKDALVNALQEQNPEAFQGFLKANSANRHLNILAKAVDAAKNQVSDNGEMLFTPAQLGTAASQNANTYSGRIASASGNRPFNDLASAAQQVMSSKLPDSGTPFRHLVQAAVLGGGAAAPGAALGYNQGGGEGAVEGGALTLGGLSLLGTRRGQQVLTKALLDRVAPFRIAGSAIRRNPQVGADILAAYGIPTLAAGD